MLYFKSAHRELWETPTVTYSWIIIGWSLRLDVSVTILLTMYSTLSAGRLKLPHTSERMRFVHWWYIHFILWLSRFCVLTRNRDDSIHSDTWTLESRYCTTVRCLGMCQKVRSSKLLYINSTKRECFVHLMTACLQQQALQCLPFDLN